MVRQDFRFGGESFGPVGIPECKVVCVPEIQQQTDHYLLVPILYLLYVNSYRPIYVPLLGAETLALM